MSVVKMAEQIKQIHPDYLLIFKLGAFCDTYGKDSYIIAANFNYMLKTTSGVQTCGFSKKILGKVMANLEDKKINYLVLYIGKEEFRKIIKDVEDILDENRKI